MTLKQLERKFQGCIPTGYGHYKVMFENRGKTYYHTTNNMLAIDRIRDRDYYLPTEKHGEGTYKQALEALWNEVKRNYSLYEYRN